MPKPAELIVTVTESNHSAYPGRRATDIGVKPPLTEGESLELDKFAPETFEQDVLIAKLVMAAIEAAPDAEVSTFDMPLAPGPEHFATAVDVAKIMMKVRGLKTAGIEYHAASDRNETDYLVSPSVVGDARVMPDASADDIGAVNQGS